MSDPPLARFLGRIDFDPCVFFHDEVVGHLAPVWGQLHRAGVVRELAPVGYAPCPDCGRHVRYARGLVDERTGQTRFLIACPDCGPSELSPDALRRWTVDIDRLLAVLGDTAGTAGAPSQVIPGLLWRLGLIPTVGTRSRAAFFARVRGEADAARVAEVMDGNPAAVLFFASPHGAGSWRRPAPAVRVALSELLTIGEAGFQFNVSGFAACLRAIADDRAEARNRTRKERKGSRPATIFKLEKEIEDFLRRAQDHAFDTKRTTGAPELLPRPEQEDLAVAVGVSPSTVSRILNKDKRAKVLRLLWDMSEDLDAIMTWDRRTRH